MHEIVSQSLTPSPRPRNARSRSEDPAPAREKGGVAMPALAAALLFARSKKGRRARDLAMQAEVPAGRA